MRFILIVFGLFVGLRAGAILGIALAYLVAFCLMIAHPRDGSGGAIGLLTGIFSIPIFTVAGIVLGGFTGDYVCNRIRQFQ